MHFLAFFEKYFGLNKASNFSIFANLAIWQQALEASQLVHFPRFFFFILIEFYSFPEFPCH